MRRRSLLTGIAGTLSLFAGCTGDSQSGSGNDTTTAPEDGSGKSTTTRSTAETTETVSPPASTETAKPTATRITRTSSGCRKTASTPGTAIVEASPVVLSIENTTNAQRTVATTVTLLPKTAPVRPSEEAPHEPRDLTASPVFSATTELQTGGVKSYRCIGVDDSSRAYQIMVQAGENPSAAYDWSRDTGELTVDITDSSIEFST